MNDQTNCIAILKLSKNVHLDDLIKLGKIHFKSTKYFRNGSGNKSANDFRMDKYEGVSAYLNIEKLTIDAKGAVMAHTDIPESELIIRGPQNEGFIFCFTMIEDTPFANGERNNLNIDEKLMNMDDTAVIIYNPKEFIRRLFSELQQSYPKFTWRPVTYIKKEENNFAYTIFNKHIEYEFQQEGRIFINMEESEEYLNILIGNLEDIAIKISANELDNVEIQYSRKIN